MRAVAVVMLVLLGFCGTNHALETQLDLVGELGDD